MNKAFVKEDTIGDEDPEVAATLPLGVKNYITPRGYQTLKNELDHLWKIERPELVKTIAWAASNGDRSENGDYIYGKKRLREIDRRVRFLRKRLEYAEVVDPSNRGECDQVFFGASVTVCDAEGSESRYCIVGVDEANVSKGHISWISPLAKALLKLRIGDVAVLRTPHGVRELEVVDVRYCEVE
jgi:transcription elongation factor GreB